jgi:hypothetical protein
LTSQAIRSGKWNGLGSVLTILAVLALAVVPAAAQAANAPKHSRGCPDGSKVASKVIRRHGRGTVVRFCRKTNTKPEEAIVAPVSSASPTTSAMSTPTTTPPATVTPLTSTPVIPTTGLTLHSQLDPSFRQNPLAPAEVTWHYSASATETVTTEGVEQIEAVPLPEGLLAFYLDGEVVCEIAAGGGIHSSACTVGLNELGEQEVATVFSASGGQSSEDARTDDVGRYPTSTSLEAVVEPVPPQRRQDIGANKYGYEQEGYEIGRIQVTGGVTPKGYPRFSCKGRPQGCMIPEGTLAGEEGPLSIPLYAQLRPNPKTEKDEMAVGFRAYEPAAEEDDFWWKFPGEADGTEFLNAVASSNPSYYEPSEATAPLVLSDGHLPFYRFVEPKELPPAVDAVEGTMTKMLTFGTYDKLGGPGVALEFKLDLQGVYEEWEGCQYEIHGVGPYRNHILDMDHLNTEQWGEINGIASGPYTFELVVGRDEGAGPGKCGLEYADLQSYEWVE